jgi:hypothetical protein
VSSFTGRHLEHSQCGKEGEVQTFGAFYLANAVYLKLQRRVLTWRPFLSHVLLLLKLPLKPAFILGLLDLHRLQPVLVLVLLRLACLEFVAFMKR